MLSIMQLTREIFKLGNKEKYDHDDLKLELETLYSIGAPAS